MRKTKTVKNLRNNNSKNDTIYMIILFKVGVANLSRQIADETFHNYKACINEELKSFDNIKIKNIILPDLESNKINVQVLYPTLKSFKLATKGFLDKIQERKLKIFELLNDI